MPKGQNLSKYQQGIVRRYYEHLDGIALTKLSESVSELYLCTDPKKAEKLWQGVERALDKTAGGDAKVRDVLKSRNIQQLARLVGELSGKS